MRKVLSVITAISIFISSTGLYLLVNPTKAHAAKLSDGTWTGTADTDTDVTITFTSSGDIVNGSYILLSFPSEAPVSSTGTDITVTDDSSSVTFTRTNNATRDTIKLTNASGGTVAGGSVIVITMTDALDSASGGYDAHTYAIQSVGINTATSADVGIDYGLAIINNDNSTTSYKTDITALVPLFVTVAVDTNSIDLGVLSVSHVAEKSQTYTVNSNNPSGVQVQIAADDDLNDAGDTVNIDNVTDGTVTAGSEEYGIAVAVTGLTADSPYNSGDNLVPNPGTSPVSPDDLVSSTGPVSGATFDITYKASISGTTTAGNYTQEVTITIATN